MPDGAAGEGQDEIVKGPGAGVTGVDVAGYRGRSTFITGPRKGCGKTSFLNAVLAGLRRDGECPGFLGIGFDGESRDALTGGSRPRIRALPGETVLTAERYLRSSDARFELLETLPGSGALGRLVLGRVLRAGEVTLVGPEGNEGAALAMRLMREEFAVGTILADGAMNRITQVSSFEGARFVFVLRVDRCDLDAQIASMKRMNFLARLPLVCPLGSCENSDRGSGCGGRDNGGSGEGAPVFIRGPLTSRVAAGIDAASPIAAGPVAVEDFTKVFLGWRELSAFAARHRLAVRRGIDFAGFVAILRNLSQAEFLSALDDPEIGALVGFNPFEVAAEADCA
ncbi:MAG: hypothetical protein Q8O15_10645 [Rectinemataceae bacterium]|nr:hypothetical protein [Rectinemataceae bacterium]